MKVFIQHYFLPQFRIIGGILLLISPIIYLEIHFLVAVLSLVLGLSLLFMTLEFEINLESKFYKKGPALFRILNFGHKVPFENTQYAYIKKGKESQRVNSRIASTSVSKGVFYALIKFSDTHRVMFCKSSNEAKLKNRISRVLSYLKISLKE